MNRKKYPSVFPTHQQFYLVTTLCSLFKTHRNQLCISPLWDRYIKGVSNFINLTPAPIHISQTYNKTYLNLTYVNFVKSWSGLNKSILKPIKHEKLVMQPFELREIATLCPHHIIHYWLEFRNEEMNVAQDKSK